jgi:hypothetical protein
MLEIQAIQSCLAPVCFAENEKWKLVHFSFKLAIEHTNPKKTYSMSREAGGIWLFCSRNCCIGLKTLDQSP